MLRSMAVVRGGMGQFLSPHNHPNSFCHFAAAGGSIASIEYVAEDNNSERFHPNDVKRAKELIQAWDSTKELSAVWVMNVLKHFHHCYWVDEKMLVVTTFDKKLFDQHMAVRYIRKYFPDYVFTDLELQYIKS